MKYLSYLLGFFCFIYLQAQAETGNQYFQPTYKPIGEVYTAPFSSQYCGPSACSYLLPTLKLAPNQPNPLYQSSSFNIQSSGAVLSNLEIYRRAKLGQGYNQLSSPNPSNKQQYIPTYSLNISPSAPLSNLEIYRRSHGQ